jgi:hypothetical protein
MSDGFTNERTAPCAGNESSRDPHCWFFYKSTDLIMRSKHRLDFAAQFSIIAARFADVSTACAIISLERSFEDRCDFFAAFWSHRLIVKKSDHVAI